MQININAINILKQKRILKLKITPDPTIMTKQANIISYIVFGLISPFEHKKNY